MSWLSSALKGITKAVSGIGPLASFIPGAGPWVAGLGALSSLEANRNAEKRMRDAERHGRGLEERASQLYDFMLSQVKAADAAGQFDPERRIAQLEKDTGRYESRDSGNLAGALRVAGYKVGDSEIGTRLDAVKEKYRAHREDMSERIRQDTFREKMDAYSSVNPNLLQPGIQGAANRASNAKGDIQDPSGFVASLAPFLKKRVPKGTTPIMGAPDSSGGALSAPVSSLASGFRLPSSRYRIPVQYGA